MTRGCNLPWMVLVPDLPPLGSSVVRFYSGALMFEIIEELKQNPPTPTPEQRDRIIAEVKRRLEKEVDVPR